MIHTKPFDVRIPDEATKKSIDALQTVRAQSIAESNCPLCALGHDANRKKVWKLAELDVDHVTVWRKGGATSFLNCQML